MIRRIFTPLIVALAVVVACSSNGGFGARPALADVPFISVTGTLTNVGDAVTITNLVGQSTCSFFVSGTTGAVDVQGTNDRSASPAWTTLAVLDYASPPNVQSQPFSPNVGQAYQFSPTSLTRARVTADSSWTGGPATVTISCSGSVARAGSGGGGGGTVTGTEPITVSANNVAFDYGHAGTFTATQAFGGSAPVLCGSQPTGSMWSSGAYAGYAYYNGSGFYLASAKNNFSTTSCQVDNIMEFIPSNEFTSTPATLNFLGAIGSIFFTNFANGCLYVNSSGQLEVNTASATCGTQVTAGTNLAFAGSALGTIAQPVFANIDFTDASLQHPGTYAGLTSDGSGQVKLVSLSPQPCPSTGCGVLGVAATEPLSSTGGTIPNISINSPIPVAYGGFGQNTSAWAGGDCVLTTGSGFTPAPCPATSIPPYPSPSPAPSFTATTPLGSSSSGNVVTTFIASPIPPSLGGLGTNVAGYANGQCPIATGSGTFAPQTCGSYTAGTNLTLTGNQFALSLTPSGLTSISSATYNVPETGTYTGSAVSLTNNPPYGVSILSLASGQMTVSSQTFNGCSIGDCQLLIGNGVIYNNTSFYRALSPAVYQILDQKTPYYCLGFSTGTGGGSYTYTCTEEITPSAATLSVPLAVSAPVSATALTDSGLTAGNGVCATTSGTLFNCNAGTFSCTISSGTACSTTATITASNEVCNVSYNHSTTVSQSQLAPAEVGVSGTTLTMYAATTSTASGTVYFNATCT